MIRRCRFIVPVAVVLLLGWIAFPALAAEGEAEEQATVMGQASALNWTLALACVLAATHLFSSVLWNFVETHEDKVGSFGGGLAAGYVFLHLFAELDKGHELVGDRIHLFVLAGFLVYYGIEFYTKQHRAKSQSPRAEFNRCLIEVGLGWVYSWLIIYAMPEALSQNGISLAPVALALVLHLFYADFHLGKQYPEHFHRWGRYVLASAPLVGWLVDLFSFADDPLVSDLLTALLAGSVIYKLFKHELPEDRRSDFAWFLIGTMCFLGLGMLAGHY